MLQKKNISPNDPVLQRLVRLVSEQINIFVRCVQTCIFYKGAYRPVYLIIGRQWYNIRWNVWMTFYVEFEDTFTPYTQQLSRLMNVAMDQHGSIIIRDGEKGWGRAENKPMHNFIVITVAPDNDCSQLRYWNSKKPDVTYGADDRMLRQYVTDIPFTPKIISQIQEIIESSVAAFAVEFSNSNYLMTSYDGNYRGI